jgi:hypothetical protein
MLFSGGLTSISRFGNAHFNSYVTILTDGSHHAEYGGSLGLGQERTGVHPCGGPLSHLTVMVTGVEWLSDPDVPVTIKVT